MKRFVRIAMAALVSGAVLSSYPVYAQEATDEGITETDQTNQQVETSKFQSFGGLISKIQKSGEFITLTVKNPEDSLEMIFPLSQDILLFDSGSTEEVKQDVLKEGQRVEVYYDRNQIVPMIYPVVMPPEIIIVHNEEKMGSVEISKFNENLLSVKGDLILHIGEDTLLLGEDGSELTKEELPGKELIVFYNIALESYPAQTTPTKIIALNKTDKLIAEINELISEDFYLKGDKRMIPLRKVAEHAGYEVTWKAGTVTFNKGYRSFQVKIGEEQYGYCFTIKHFEAAPELVNGKTYVSEEIIDMLIQQEA